MILVNGAVATQVDAMDRGLLYGDGVFRTMRCESGRIHLLDQHLVKLNDDCRALGLNFPGLVLREEIQSAVNHQESCVVKAIITRGKGVRGYRPASDSASTRIVITDALPRYPATFRTEGIRVRICATRLGHQPRLAGIKHLNRLENVLARGEWDDPDIAEGLMLDEAGSVIEGTMSNLFVRRGGTLFTPELSRCGVAGLIRQRIIDSAPSAGFDVVITPMDLNFVMTADEIFMCNSVVGLWPVQKIDERPVRIMDAVTRLERIIND